MTFDNTNRGSIWKNDKKKKDTHPDFTGSINIEGVEYWLNGWKRKEGAAPKSPAMSFTVRRKDAAGKPAPSRSATLPKASTAAVGRGDDMEDEIPFSAEFR